MMSQHDFVFISTINTPEPFIDNIKLFVGERERPIDTFPQQSQILLCLKCESLILSDAVETHVEFHEKLDLRKYGPYS